MAVESTCLLIAGVLMLITIIILIIGTVIVSFCSRDEEIDYHMIPQGDWHPEHLDYDSIIDLLQSIQKSKKFQDLQDFLAQGKHLVHLNDRWEETEWSCFPFQRRKTQRITWQYGAEIPNLSGLDFSIVLRQGLARFKFFFVYCDISVQIRYIWRNLTLFAILGFLSSLGAHVPLVASTRWIHWIQENVSCDLVNRHICHSYIQKWNPFPLRAVVILWSYLAGNLNKNDNYPKWTLFFFRKKPQEVTIGSLWCYIISVALLQHRVVLLCVDFYLSAHVLIFFAYILNYGKTNVV